MEMRVVLPSLFLVSVALSACGSVTGSDQSEVRKLVVTGSSTVAPLAAEIAKRYERENAGTRIDVQTGGSSRGIADARNGLADVGMVSRALKSAESDLRSHAIAIDGIAVIVHRDNPISELSKSQLVKLFNGEISDWSELGGSGPVVVVNKAQGRSTLELFLKYTGLGDREVDADIVIGDNEQGIKTISGNPNAIGYVSIGAAEYNIKAGTPLKMLSLNGAKPSTEAVRRGEYPLTRPLNLVTDNMPKALADEFIRFARSDAVADLVLGLYFVPVSAELTEAGESLVLAEQ